MRDAQENYDRHREEDIKRLSSDKISEINDLSSSFPTLWHDPKTSDRDRKRMARLLIEDVTLTKGAQLFVGIRFRGGATKQLLLSVPKNAFDECKTAAQIVTDIDRLLDTQSDYQIAEHFNSLGLKTGKGFPFTRERVNRIQEMYGLRTRFDRLRANGWLTRTELAKQLGVTGQTVQRWAEEGRLNAKTYKKKLKLYADPGANGPKPMSHADRGRRGMQIKQSMNVSPQ